MAQAPKEDPKEKERNKTRTWISDKLETLSSQKDAYEVEIETLTSSKKNKKKDNGASRRGVPACSERPAFSLGARIQLRLVPRWEDLIERCRFHEEKLEIVRAPSCRFSLARSCSRSTRGAGFALARQRDALC